MSAVADYFDARAGRWDAESEPFGAKHLATASIAGVGAGARVLDAGCGTGVMVRAYLELGAAEVVGVDVSAEMVACAARKFAGEPRVRFVCADAAALPADAAGPFDVVVIYNAYPHMKDKAAVVRAAAEALRPGGRFLVAHGAGRDAINAHHAGGLVPAEVADGLRPAAEEARAWRALFDVDTLMDAPFRYFFGGAKRVGWPDAARRAKRVG